MALRPKTDYLLFDEQIRHEEHLIRLMVDQYGANHISLPYDVNSTDPDEAQENARTLYNAMHIALGKPEVSKEEFDILVKQLRDEMERNPNWFRKGIS